MPAPWLPYVTGSAFLYFVQPTASTFLVAMLFLVTAVARRPIIEKLARDFCPLDPEMFARPLVRRFFLRLSLLWFVVLATQAGFIMWLLLESSVRTFVVERSLVSAVLTVGGSCSPPCGSCASCAGGADRPFQRRRWPPSHRRH